MSEPEETCRGCGDPVRAHRAVGLKDHGEPVVWTTECDDCAACDELLVDLLPGPSQVVEVDVPLEERLRTWLVGAALMGGAVALLLLLAAFGLAVAARWSDTPRPLDGTAVLAVLAASVVGVLSVVAGRYGIGPSGPDDAAALPGDERAGDGAR